MNSVLNALIIDDHPIIVNAIKMAMAHISLTTNLEFNISSAHDCETADTALKVANRSSSLDLVILDISLPISKNCKFLSGEDIGIEIRESVPEAKLIVMTSHSDNHILYNIFKSLNPDGFLIKSDIDNQDLIKALKDVIDGIPYYTKTVTRLIRSHMASQIVLDKIDREILYHLSTGTKMKDLPDIVNLSLAGIERRKRNLRDVFDTQKKDDKALIERAKEKGFV
jgi:DNA-binding NarL/FixJ family response regulator